MNIEAEKSMIIEQVKKVYDADLLGALKSMLDYAQKKEQKIYDIPVTHQNLVMERFEKTRANPDMLLDWDEVRKTL